MHTKVRSELTVAWQESGSSLEGHILYLDYLVILYFDHFSRTDRPINHSFPLLNQCDE